MMRRYVFLLAMLIYWAPAVSFSAYAFEIPAVSPLEFPVVAEPAQSGASWELVAYLAAASVLAWLGKFADQWIRDWLARRKIRVLEKGYHFVARGVSEVYETTVRGLKAAKDSGEWNALKKLQVKNEAIDTAKQYAKQNGFDLMKKVGAETVDLLVEQVIGDRKAGKYVLAPLADLP